jgi:hypothetical protein
VSLTTTELKDSAKEKHVKGFPAWNVAELERPPLFRLRDWTLLIGPGLLMAGSNIGGGEWLLGPLVTAQYGGQVLWLATIAIMVQVFYNLSVMRYALYTGESIFVGFFRTRPGPKFWTAFYLIFDLGTYFPFLAANAAVPLAAVILHRLPTAEDSALVKNLSQGIFLCSFVPLIFGGKIYNSLEKLMVTKLVLVLGYLGFIAIFLVGWDTKWEIFSGLFRFGALPEGNFNWATLAAFAAIAGAGGLTNTSFSNHARDKGWGMGPKVGAIPSAIGGKTIKLSHTGKVFELTQENLVRWKGWLRHILRDQMVLWAPACIIGAALPAMISYEFIRGVKGIDGNAAAAMTAHALSARYGEIFWFLTLLCGFLIFFPTQISVLDGISRRWTDVIWMGVRKLHTVRENKVKYVYYSLLSIYGLWGLIVLQLTPNPLVLALATGVLVNFAMCFSSLHVLYVNLSLLPKELRPPWHMCAGLVCCSLFYGGISTIAFVQQWPKIVGWLYSNF